MKEDDLWLRLLCGAVAGVAGTILLQGLLGTHQRLSPGSLPPFREEPGGFMLRKAKQVLPGPVRERIPESVETRGGQVSWLGLRNHFRCFILHSAPLRPEGRVGGNVARLGGLGRRISWLAAGHRPDATHLEASTGTSGAACGGTCAVWSGDGRGLPVAQRESKSAESGMRVRKKLSRPLKRWRCSSGITYCPAPSPEHYV